MTYYDMLNKYNTFKDECILNLLHASRLLLKFYILDSFNERSGGQSAHRNQEINTVVLEIYIHYTKITPKFKQLDCQYFLWISMERIRVNDRVEEIV